MTASGEAKVPSAVFFVTTVAPENNKEKAYIIQPQPWVMTKVEPPSPTMNRR